MKFTFAELEDLAADWEKLGRWRDHIAARDFFGAPGRGETDAVRDRARTALDIFTNRDYEQPDTAEELALSVARPDTEMPARDAQEVQ